MKGFVPTVVCSLPANVIYFVTYGQISKVIKANEWLRSKGEKTVETVATVIGGGLAGLALWTVIFPLDSFKSISQSDSLDNPQYKNYLDLVQKSLKKRGVKNLYNGFNVCALRAMPANAAVFLAYENTRAFLSKRFTK